MKRRECLVKAQDKYDAKMKQVKIKLNKETDKDIIEQLDRQESVVGYLRQLIRKDIRESNG